MSATEPAVLSDPAKEKLRKNPAEARRKLLPFLLQKQGNLRNLNQAQAEFEQKNNTVRTAVLEDYRRMVERPKRWQERCRNRGKRFLAQHVNDAATVCEEKSTASVVSDSCSQVSKDSFMSWFDELVMLDQMSSDHTACHTQKNTSRMLYQGGSSLSLFPLIKSKKRIEEDNSSACPEEDEVRLGDKYLVDYRQQKISKTEQRKAAKLLEKASFSNSCYDGTHVLPIKPYHNGECFVSLKPGVYFQTVLASIANAVKRVRMPTTLLLGLEDTMRGGSLPLKACLTSNLTRISSFASDPTDKVAMQNAAIESITSESQHNKVDKLPIAVCKRACLLAGGNCRSVISFLYDEKQLQEEVDKAGKENTPVAFQSYIKAKGGRPWILRIHWRSKSGCVQAWMLTSTASFATAGNRGTMTPDYQLSTCSSRVDRCSIVPLRPSVWKEPCQLTEELAGSLIKVHNLPLVEFAVDFVQDENCMWWVLQVKAFQLSSDGMEAHANHKGGTFLVPKQKSRVILRKPSIVAPAEPSPTCKGSHCIGPEDRSNPSTSIPYRYILFQRVHAALGLHGKVPAEKLEEVFNAREQREQFNNVLVCEGCYEIYSRVPKDLLLNSSPRESGQSSKRSDAACARLYNNYRTSMRRKTEPILEMLREEEEIDKTKARRRRAKLIKARKKRNLQPPVKGKATFYDLHAGDRVVLVDTSNAGTVVRCDENNSRVTVKFDDGFTVNRIERSLLICKEKHLTNEFKLSADELISVGAVPPTSTYEFNRDRRTEAFTDSDSDSSVASPRLDYADHELRMVDEELYTSASKLSSPREAEGSSQSGIYCPFGCGRRLKPDSQSLTDAHKAWKAHMDKCSKKFAKTSM